MFGKPGRPPEDRALRQREIYRAVGPLVLRDGAKRVTVRDAAAAALMSVGGLYHYFPTKRSLLLYGLHPEAFERLCLDFHEQYDELADRDPQRYLSAFIELQVEQIFFVRPALHAAVELGADAFWQGLEDGIQVGLDGFARTLRQVLPDAEKRDLRLLGRTIRRTLVAALLDRSVTAEELRAELHALVQGEPVAQRQVRSLSA